MSNMQASVRGLSKSIQSPAEMCRQLNRVVLENTRCERFTTLFYGVLDVAEGRLCYASAGHVPPFLARQDGTMLRLCEGGTVLGLFGNSPYEESHVEIRPGDRLVLVTDGITEAANDRSEEFGEDRLIRLLLDNAQLPPAVLQRLVIDAVSRFAGQQLQDDATLVIASVR
jgi:sigma-B regulation protein RsbU (phosphoserine phosphatase)